MYIPEENGSRKGISSQNCDEINVNEDVLTC